MTEHLVAEQWYSKRKRSMNPKPMNPKPCILQLESFILTQNFEAKSAFLLTSKFQPPLQ